MKKIRIALGRDGRVRVVPNVVGLMIPWSLIARAVASHDLDVLSKCHPIHAGLGTGSPDLVGILRGGRVFCLEVKGPKTATGKEQPAWQAALRAWGGFVCVVRSPEDAVAAVERAMAGGAQ